MSLRDLRAALDSKGQDDALVRHFLSVWPMIERILEAFSKATGLPIFGFLGDAKVFQSSIETMPPFCAVMLSAPELAQRCVADGLRRAQGIEPDVPDKDRIQYCHAGMLNGRCEIDTGFAGPLSVLFGSKKSVDAAASRSRKAIIASVGTMDSALAQQLRSADDSDLKAGEIASSDIALMTAIAGVIQQLIGATVGFRSLTINMAHELSLMMLNAGLLAREMKATIDESLAQGGDSAAANLRQQRQHIYNQCQLGLYVVRNFLSHTSETRYADVVRPQFSTVDLNALLIEMVELHKGFAATKSITVDVAPLQLPTISGSAMELRRLFHNILNNAIKYSYHSIAETQRTIRVWFKVPYDPGFAHRRFAIVVENYGLGLKREEISHAFRAGFRGGQAAAEVAIGAGIGLSEALKIMKVHGGDIKIRSRQLHETSDRTPTYLTTVELIFRYREGE
jgi:signal transduction histidine kinase